MLFLLLLGPYKEKGFRQFILIYHIIIQQCFVLSSHWSSYLVSIGLGLDNFGFYIDNDTLQGLQRTEDIKTNNF